MALLEGEAAWAQEFEQAMRQTEGAVCIDGIDLLSDELLDLVIEDVARPSRPQLVLTSGPVGSLTGRAAALASTATPREELLSLASRRAEIPDLAASILRSIAASGSVYLTPSAVQALSAQAWPGNLRELKAVLTQAASQRTAGGISVADLPERYRSVTPTHPMAALDQAECAVIMRALREADGNKVKAARELGLSRTTLYARIRQLQITSW